MEFTKVIKGKSWTYRTNQDKAVSPDNTPEFFELLRSLPRVGVDCKHRPIVQADDGTKIYIGAAAGRLPGEQGTGYGYGSNSTKTSAPQVSAIPEAFWEYVSKVKGLPEEFKSLVKEQQEAAKAAKEAEKKAQIAAKLKEMNTDDVLKLLGL